MDLNIRETELKNARNFSINDKYSNNEHSDSDSNDIEKDLEDEIINSIDDLTLHQLDIKINRIDKKIDVLNDKLNNILDIIQKDIQPDCNKMVGHVNFVENVYDNLKKPINYIANKVNSIREIEMSQDLGEDDCLLIK